MTKLQRTIVSIIRNRKRISGWALACDTYLTERQLRKEISSIRRAGNYHIASGQFGYAWLNKPREILDNLKVRKQACRNELKTISIVERETKRKFNRGMK